MTTLTLTPAYGRDYTSKAAVLKDWQAGKDFQIANAFHKDDGRYINKQDADRDGISASIRYKGQTRIVIIKPEKPETVTPASNGGMHASITIDRVTAAVESEMFGTDNPGFCHACGESAEGCEPDARNYTCGSCGEAQVFGAEETMLMVQP